jgi:acetylornithine/succinyldiaminopimelate/putrescine aminotransferase
MNQRQLFLNHLAQTSPFPMGLEVARAEGVYLIGRDGRKYLDLIAGIGVSSLGHCHPAVVKAVQRQAETFMHVMVYGEYVLPPQVDLATLMTKHLPPSLNNVYFTNSGTEATEGAMKLAKRHTGRSEFVAAFNSYHGSTQGAASLMNPKDFTRAFHPLLPGINHLDFNCDFCLDRITEKTAAVILETVQAEWGIRKPRPEWLQAVRKRCDEVGALLILDEIQAGYGRTGTLWAFEQYGVVPDILLLAKGMGGGMPIGAFVSSREIMIGLSDRPILGHITTFGGHPVSCAAGLATLTAILESNCYLEVPLKTARFLERLKHKEIRDLRHAGLWMAMELDNFDKVQAVIKHCLENGLITDWFLFNDRSIRIAPPLIITLEEIDLACDILLAGLDSLS